MQNPGNHTPLVSICIPVFNGEATIRKTLDSILNQTYKNIEIIVMDNNSTDSTVKIVKEFGDPRLRLIENDVFVSCNDNFNRCFQYVNGELMAFFHADDVYLPEIISRQVETFSEYPIVGSVFTQGNVINEDDEIVAEFHLPQTIRGSTPYSYHDILIASLENCNFLPCPSAMMRTDLYKRLSPFQSFFGPASDFDLFLRAAESAPIIILDEKLFNYRISKVHGQYYLNKTRVHEGEFFKAADYHISKSKIMIPGSILDKYEQMRFADMMFRMENCLQTGNMKEYKRLSAGCFRTKYILLMVTHPILFASLCSKFLGFLKYVLRGPAK